MNQLFPVLDDAFVTNWLALPSLPEQQQQLETAGLLHTQGLTQLVELAGQWMRRDPGQAQLLLASCLEIAKSAGIPSILPRATYLKAQTHALAGEFEPALQLIQSAQAGYRTTGQESEALSTYLGLMHVLAELGQYQDALQAGQAVLDNPSSQQIPLTPFILQNIGLCYRRLGQYEAAFHAYRTAETYYLSLGMLERAGDIRNNRGVLLLELGRGQEALTTLEDALALRTALGQTFLQAQTLNNLGSVHLLLGNYSQSLAIFEQARQLLATQHNSLDQSILLLDTAHAYLTLNLYQEAIIAYRQADHQLAMAGATHHRILALWGLAAALLIQQNFAEAEKLLQTALSLLQTPSTPLFATLLLEQAAIQAAQGDLKAAQATAQETLQLATQNDWTVPQLYAHLRLSDLFLSIPAQAETHLIAAQPLVESLDLPQLRYRWLERYGRLRRLQGNDQAAQPLLEAALTEIERLRSTLSQETLRASFLQDKVMAYEELVQLLLARGDLSSLQQAFVVAEQAKSRSLVDLMNGVITAQLNRESPNLQQLQQLQNDLNTLYNDLLDTNTQGQRKIRPVDVQQRIQQLEKEIRQIQLRLAIEETQTNQLRDPFLPQELPGEMPADIVLISYYQVGDEILTFVSRQEQITVLRELCHVSEIQGLLRRLNVQWSRFRIGSEFINQHIPLLERAAQQLLGTFYQQLFAPLEPLLIDAEKLVIVPHGLLHHIPFHALFDGQDYLLERFEISYAPSATVFMLCQNRLPNHSAKIVVMGVTDPSIPSVVQEVQAVASHFSESNVFLNEQATLQSLQLESANCAYLHLASHGFFRADNPMFSAIRLYDGWLTAAQAIQLPLENSFVTLSGCETGLSQVIYGDELLGLTRAFLGAGATTLVVSLWLAQDQTTAELMSIFYKQLQREEVGATAALRHAQCILKRTHPHPYYWAPFILIGQRHAPERLLE